MEKIKSLKVLEWNINQRSMSREIPNYVSEEILRKEPDIIVLVEFKGDINSEVLKERLSNYYISYYNGVPNSSNTNRTGNGILAALNKKIFVEPKSSDISLPKNFDDVQPNWLKIRGTLKDNQTLDIIGIRTRIGKESKADLQGRKEQIEWLLNENKDLKRQIVIGDLNYGPHRTAYKADKPENRLNWCDIIEMIKTCGYLIEEDAPYSPQGFSWKYAQLDWLISKGVYVNKESDYNELDWSFGRYNTEKYVDGYLVPEGYFIRTESSYPDHAIFTVEITL